jgi:hypothetical protein
VEPAVTGQMASLITGYFNLVLYLQRESKAEVVTGKPSVLRPVYVCRSTEPVGHRAPAGGTLWGHTFVEGEVDGSYAGLRALCAKGKP